MIKIAFIGSDFIFDGIPSEQYGIMLYSIDDIGQETTSDIGPRISISEDRIARRYSPIHYGTSLEKPLKFTMVCGSLSPVDRYDTSVIDSWLFGHSQYKWLEIVQPDLANTRFRCILDAPEAISIDGLVYAVSCNVICDSPFAYSYPEEYNCIGSASGTDLMIHNYSSYRGNYYPQIEIIPSTGTDAVTIVNNSDDNREFILSNLNHSGITVSVDCLNQVIKTDAGVNLYNSCNFQFPRLIPGDNFLVVKGAANVRVICEYPIAVGS